MYHTENEEKSSVVGRWNKTMKNRMWKMFTVNNNTVYWDKLDKLVNDYNNARHSSIKMTPVKASKKKNEKIVWSNLYGDSIYLKPDDLMGEEIKGSFYEQELQKAKQQTFRIEKIIRRDNKKKMALVKWSGYPDKFNSWVSSKDLVDF